MVVANAARMICGLPSMTQVINAQIAQAQAAQAPQPAAQMDPALVKAMTDIAQLTAASTKPKDRKVKTQTILDPADDSEVRMLESVEITECYNNYKDFKGGMPMRESDPTPDQISAMKTRVLVLGMEPYGDFSILTPYGRRLQKGLRHKGWTLQEDGSYKSCELPGPEDFDMWYACWKVFATILLMLRWPPVGEAPPEAVATPSALDEYLEEFRAIVKEHPECWHLCCRAEDRCRLEHFPRVKRELTQKNGTVPTWSEVFIAAAHDDRYWDREVRRPALAFIARGKRSWQDMSGNDVTRLRDGILKTPTEEAQHLGGGGSPTTTKLSRAQRKRARKGDKQPIVLKSASQSQRDRKDNNSNPGKGNVSKGGSASSTGDHPKKDQQGRFVTTREGTQICYKFQMGRDSCDSTCPNGRAHVCQKCLNPHRTAECRKDM